MKAILQRGLAAFVCCQHVDRGIIIKESNRTYSHHAPHKYMGSSTASGRSSTLPSSFQKQAHFRIMCNQRLNLQCRHPTTSSLVCHDALGHWRYASNRPLRPITHTEPIQDSALAAPHGLEWGQTGTQRQSHNGTEAQLQLPRS